MARLERGLLPLLVLLLILAAGKATWIDGKAWLAQVLIAHAWEQTLADGRPHPPWPWADTWPVARLTTPAGKDLYVLDSASGQAMAFGPGRLAAGANGGLVLAGHRDTHFRFLKDLEKGDPLRLQQPDGQWTGYHVTASTVADSRRETLRPPSEDKALLLVTCYPFDASDAGGPLRYVVSAKAVNALALSDREYPGR